MGNQLERSIHSLTIHKAAILFPSDLHPDSGEVSSNKILKVGSFEPSFFIFFFLFSLYKLFELDGMLNDLSLSRRPSGYPTWKTIFFFSTHQFGCCQGRNGPSVPDLVLLSECVYSFFEFLRYKFSLNLHSHIAF